jgi:threonyl-tRNA synthetase
VGVRVEVDPADEQLGSRIRKAKLQKVPHVVVVGAQDEADGTLADNTRGDAKPVRGIPVDDFVATMAVEAALPNA